MTDPRAPYDRKLRILHVLRAPLGGLFRHVVDLTHEQVARGHAVGLVVDSRTGGERAVANLAELNASLELGIKRIPMLRQPHLNDVGTLFKVATYVRKLGVDIVHGHGSKGGLYARAPGFFQRRPTPIRCYTPHGGSFNHVAPPIVQSVYMAVERLLARRTDVLLFESLFIANRFKERIGETGALVRIVQNGISSAEFNPVRAKPDAADFVYIGELRSAKGVDTLIDAIAIMTRRIQRPISLVLVGSGPDQEKLEDQAARRSVARQIRFTGAVPARQAFELGRTLVVPSRAESLPYIVLEAAGAQVPMIATNVGGIVEIFGPYRDRLIPCDNPLILAQAMEHVLEQDPATLRQRAAELTTFVSSRFLVSTMAEAVLGGYRDALSGREASTAICKHPFALSS